MPEENVENPFENFETLEKTPGPMRMVAKGFFSELDAVEKAVTDLMKAHNELAVLSTALLKALVAKGIVTEEEFTSFSEKAREGLGIKPIEKKED